MNAISSNATVEVIPDKPIPFLGSDYYQSLAWHVERGSVFDKLITRHIGSTAAGKVVEKTISTEMATRINAITALKLAHAIRSMRSTRERMQKEKIYKFHWSEFQTSFLEYATNQDEVTVLQIGAYDGRTNDRLHPLLMQNPNWRAVLVEPMPQTFERLMRNYAGRPNTTLVNSAVSNQDGEIDMFAITPTEKTPLFLDQTATTKPRTLNSFMAAGAIAESLTVRTSTVENLLADNSIDKQAIGLLFVDAEGCDAEILMQMMATDDPLPPYIVAEHDHMSDEEYSEVIDGLINRQYIIRVLAHDLLAQREMH
ncbi:MAG: FkbM family methyltransferase [Candidatus Saccharimonadales bacterium]